MSSTAPHVAAIVAAAGESRRFGSPKMLAPFRGEPLLRATIKNVMQAGLDDVAVVIDPGAAGLREALADLNVRIAINPDPSNGLGSTIAAGVREVGANADAIVVMLGDQPALDPSIIRALRDAWLQTRASIIVPEYRGQRAPPVLFSREVFPELETLTGEAGARPLIEREPSRVQVVRIDAEVPPDVDTPADLARLAGG